VSHLGGYVLRRAGFIVVLVFCSFLGACGTPPKTVTIPDSEVSVSGLWRDTSFVLESCGVQGSFGLELDLVQTGQRVAGSSLLEFVDGGTSETTSFTGTFEGTALTGTTFYPIRNSSGEVTSSLKFDFTLKYQNGILSGEMRSAEFTCANQTVGQMQSSLKLITASVTPVSPDALEPNNLPSQAKSIQNGETIKGLTLGQGDVDWYTFTVAENSQATVLLELLTEFPVAITVFDESELLGIYSSQALQGELQAQANLLDVTVAMTPGNYYIAVSAVVDETLEGNHDANGKYELSLATRAVPLDENEFNNLPETATPITLDYAKELSLYKGDRDWFTFTLTETREVTVDITGSTEEFIYELFIADATTSILYAYQSAFLQKTATLTPGTYYLKTYNSYADIEYSLNVSAKPLPPLPDNAYEPNNTRETARQISLDFNATLALSPEDEDWFTFTLSEERLVTFDVAKQGGYSVVLLEAQGPELGHFYYDQVVTLPLKAGSYALRFYAAYYNQTKTVSISSKPFPDAGLEPNNEVATATAITLPHEQQGYLQSLDEDWYKFTLSSAQLVTLDLGQATGNLYYELFAEGEAHSFNYYAAPVQQGLNAGTYYLHLATQSYNVGQAYTLKLSGQNLPDQTYEPNNSFNSARTVTLPFNQDLYLTTGDEDWFKFTVTGEQVLSFGGSTLNGGVAVYLYNDQGQLLKESSFQSSSLAVAYLVSAGTYYLKFVPGYYAAAYTVSVSTEALPDVALEPNNTLAQATAINLGFNREMLVSGSNDDWFSFTLTETTQVSIALTQSRYGYLTGYLTKSGEVNQQSLYNFYEPILAAGTYYIQITSYDTVKYRLSVLRK
jgi:hypothetical protein